MKSWLVVGMGWDGMRWDKVKMQSVLPSVDGVDYICAYCKWHAYVGLCLTGKSPPQFTTHSCISMMKKHLLMKRCWLCPDVLSMGRLIFLHWMILKVVFRIQWMALVVITVMGVSNRVIFDPEYENRTIK